MGLISTVQQLFSALVYNGSSFLPFIPTSIKAIFLFLLVLQFPSFPLSWHIGVFKNYTKERLRIRAFGHERWLDEWQAQNKKNGGVRAHRNRIKKRATPGQCDFNMHLSNSSYALNADRARIEWMIAAIGPIITFATGAYAALGAGYFVYIKEIPMGSEYFMETRVTGWGDKWFYGTVEYIIYPGSKSRKSNSKRSESDRLVEGVKEKLSPLAALKRETIPSIGSTDTSTPVSPGSPASGLEGAKQAATVRAREPREDGGVVACVAVFEACFKIGRITIPPRIAMHYSLQSPDPSAQEHARKICLSKDQGRSWLKGGWKEEPNAATLGREIGPLGRDGNDDWFKGAEKGMVKVNQGLAESF